MATVTLRAPLKDLAGGQTDVEIPGDTVGEVIRALEAQNPKLRGWILDEQGHVRQHVNVFVNGERMAEDANLAPTDRLHVLPSISGGCA
ncbi:MAG: MoaD/ThiS family protein [Actinobacteria bacterium]|nr:MoaD/ThiS family protein [Actinomycetota bacterium]